MAKIPRFQSEQEESEFWDTHDATEFLDETAPADLKFIGPPPRKVLISIRFDQETIDKLKMIAEHKGIGYQTLIRMWVKEQLALQMEMPNAPEPRRMLAQSGEQATQPDTTSNVKSNSRR